MSAPTKGDRVQERKTGKLGTVTGASGYGINIRMDGPEIVVCNYALLVHFERDFAPAPTNPALSERQSFAAIQPKRFGLFVWHFDARYWMEERIADTAMYISQTSAEKAADAMNARGEHGGKVVVRTPLDGPK